MNTDKVCFYHKKLRSYLNVCYKRALFLLFLMLFFHTDTFSQKKENTNQNLDFSGSVSISNNGFDVVPAFNLGKPDVSVSFSAGKRFTVEPTFRLSLEGKPWKFRFVTRYKLIKTEKFRLDITATPIINFLEASVVENGVEKKIIRALRVSTTELIPSYFLTDNVTIGLLLLHSHGFDIPSPDFPRNVQSYGINCAVNNIGLFNAFLLTGKPQLYYLQLDHDDRGFYFSSNFAIEKKEFPLSIFSTINKSISTKSNILSTNFQWNIGLIYRIIRPS